MGTTIIRLEKGEAKRPYFEMSEVERKEVSVKVWEEVKRKAASIGKYPITRNTLNSK
ncbi:MAG: hypothetical protein ACK5WF_12500 [Cyclobacteriaceae bacterium]